MNPTELMVLQGNGELNPNWMNELFDTTLLPLLADACSMSLPKVIRPSKDFKDPNLGKIKALLSSWTVSYLSADYKPKTISLWNWDNNQVGAAFDKPGLPLKAQLVYDWFRSLERSKSWMYNSSRLVTEDELFGGLHQISVKPSQVNHHHMDLVHTLVKNSVKRLRAYLTGSNKIVLLGRDVWVWAIMCQKMGVPYVFAPWVSRHVARSTPEYADALNRYEIQIQEGDVIFDTGFAGTIFQATKTVLGTNMYRYSVPIDTLQGLMLSSGTPHVPQLFPHYGLARNRALGIEYLPKFFATGTVKEGRVVQFLADRDKVLNSLILSTHFWNRQSPAWIKGASSKDKIFQSKFN